MGIQLLLLVLLISAGPILGWVAIRRSNTLRIRVENSERRLSTLEQRNDESKEAARGEAVASAQERTEERGSETARDDGAERSSAPANESERTPAREGTAPAQTSPSHERAEPADMPASAHEREGTPEHEAAPKSEMPVAAPSQGQPRPPQTISGHRRATDEPESLEQALASRWLVWLGAITIALAGIFLIKYSIEREWLGPWVRCTLGGFAGAALCAAADWCRREATVRTMPLNIAPALAGAGISTLYASAYAAFTLYDLIPAPIAFAALAGVSALAFTFAMVLGPLIAALGVVGGYLTPALASTGTGSALALFGFISALALSTAAIVHYRKWDTIALLNLAGASIWPAIWLADPWTWPDTPIIGTYLLGLAALAIYGRPGTRAGTEERREIDEAMVLGGAGVCATLVFALAATDGHNMFAVLTLGALCALLVREAAREPRRIALAGIALATVLATFASWKTPEFIGNAGQALGEHGWLYDLGGGPWIPPHLVGYTTWAAVFGSAFAVTGFAVQRRGANRWRWAAGSAGAPIALLALAYWQFGGRGANIAWAGVALTLAVLSARAAYEISEHRTRPGSDETFLAYVIGTVTMTSFAMTLALDDEWLSIGLALQVPVLALLHDRITIAGLRYICWTVSTVVTTRLVLDATAVAYNPGTIPGFGWALYGYGIPCATFWYAARRLRAHEDSALVRSLEAGALAFAVSLVTLQIRYWIASDIEGPAYPFAERSLQSIAWLTMAYALYTRSDERTAVVMTWGWRVLGSAAIAHIVFLQILAGPLLRSIPIGDRPVANVMFLAYVVPAGLAALIAIAAQRRNTADSARVAKIAWTAVLALGFVEMTLEVRHAFQGSIIAWNVGATTDIEWYAYSIAWLTYAGGLLALAIRKKSTILRYTSLALVTLTTAKLFLFDMNTLEGLLRVLSFLGLGSHSSESHICTNATCSRVSNQHRPGGHATLTSDTGETISPNKKKYLRRIERGTSRTVKGSKRRRKAYCRLGNAKRNDMCSACGEKSSKLTPSTRSCTCAHCNTKHDRDENAAVNIEAKGLTDLKIPSAKHAENPLLACASEGNARLWRSGARTDHLVSA